MRLSAVGVPVLIAALLAGSGGASGRDGVVPRFSLGTTSAVWDAEVTLRVERVPELRRQQIRLYLVRAGEARAMRTRFDPRLHFVGTVRASTNARLRFRVPPLEAGRYALGYWCPGCLPRGTKIGVQRAPALRVSMPAGEECPATRPTTLRPPGLPRLESPLTGNGALWTLASGVIRTNTLGGAKLPWIALPGMRDQLTVRYRRLDGSSDVHRADVVSGTLTGYVGPSWASRMSFEPGCWLVTGRVLDVSLSFVVRVELGPG